MSLTFVVNRADYTADPPEGQSLLELLRDDLHLTGSKLGCGEGACGACTVLIGSRAIQACQVEAASVAGQRITTVEGLAEDGILHPVQQAWLETGAWQCGYCTPGWLTGTAALLARIPHPDDERIDAELAGHACRCCAYPRIRQAVHRAAELMDQPELLEPVPAASAAAGPAAPEPDRPWDLSRSDPASFAAAMPDGLLTVVAEDGEQGWGGPDDAWVHVGADGAIEKPARRLFLIPICRLRRKIAGQGFKQCRYAQLQRGRVLAWRSILRLRSREFHSARDQFGADGFQPVPHPFCRAAIVFVVAFDQFAGRVGQLRHWIQLQLMFDKVTRLVRLLKRHSPTEIAKLLNLFQGILFDACPNTLLNNGVKIDEHPAAKEPINLFFLSRIPQH